MKKMYSTPTSVTIGVNTESLILTGSDTLGINSNTVGVGAMQSPDYNPLLDDEE